MARIEIRPLEKTAGRETIEYLSMLVAAFSLVGPIPAYGSPAQGDRQLVSAPTFGSTVFFRAIRLSVDELAFQRVSQSSEVSGSATQAQEHWERGRALASSGDLDDASGEFRTAMTLVPGNAQYVYALGVVLARQGKLEEAVDHFQQALKLDPRNLAIRQNLAAAEWQVGKLPDAERNLQFILQQRPNDQDASFLLGMVLENRGQYAKAAKLLAVAQDQVRLHPESVAAILHCYYETSKLTEAHELENTLLRDPSQSRSIFMGAVVAEEAGDYPSAEKMLMAVRGVDPSLSEVDYQLAVLRYRTGQYPEAEEILHKLIAQDGEASKYFNLLAWCLGKQDKVTDAVKAFDRAIDLDPQKGSNYVDLATVLMNAGLLAPALEAANKAVEVASHSYPAYRIRGQIQTRQHDYTAAVDSYTEAIELNKEGPEPLLDLADAQAAAGQFEKASSTLEASIKKYPREAQFYYQYAAITLHHSSSDDAVKQSKATALLQKALSLDDSIAGAHYELGNIWLEQGQPVKALGELQKAAKLNAMDENTHYALWLVLRKLGRSQQAGDELQIFKKLKAGRSEKPN